MQQFSLSEPYFSKIASYVCSDPIPKNWEQPFAFKGKSYSLDQFYEGSCGLFSSLQALICLKLKYNSNVPNEQLLIETLLDVMESIRKCYVFVTNVDFNAKQVSWCSTDNRQIAQSYIFNSKWHKNPRATLFFVYSLVILLGPVWLETYAFPDAFIVQNQTSLNLVNLILTGKIIDSFHDDIQVVCGVPLKGVSTPQKIGFISISESDQYQSIGKKFSNPTENIWIGYYGGHFTTFVKLPNQIVIEFDPINHKEYFHPLQANHAFYDKFYLM